MSVELKSNLKVKKSSEKNFGYTFSIIFLLFFLYFFVNNNFQIDFYNSISLFIFLIFLLVTLFFDKILYYPNLFWFKFGNLLSLIISPIILLFVYFFSIVIFGFLIRVFKGNLLDIYFEKNLKTYWQERKDQPTDMKNQF